jgi:putative intracellular protease/amidase/YHS domain-containing protein
MKRRELLKGAAAFGVASALPLSIARPATTSDGVPKGNGALPAASPLKPPAEGSIPVAFVISDGAVMIDFAGPWEVFQDAAMGVNSVQMTPAFKLYTVAETTKPIKASAGMKIIPDYSIENAPAPKVIVVPAQHSASKSVLDWIRKSSQTADVTMSVCTGAFVLAEAGLLSGKTATTHHSSYKTMAMENPDIHVKRGARFVEDGNIATAGGLSSGIDLALRVVERYYGREAADRTAYFMEYQGKGWLNADSNDAYAKIPVSTDAHPLCPVCEMEVAPGSSLKSVYKSKTYYFCMQDHKQAFDASPDKYLNAT